MAKTIISEGKTTNEAIENGLKQLNVSRKMVDIKVLENEKRSFFSILAPRVVKVEKTVKDENKKNDSTSNNQETVKSTVKAENKQEVKKENTGDDENIIGIALLLLGSLVVLTYIRKKKID